MALFASDFNAILALRDECLNDAETNVNTVDGDATQGGASPSQPSNPFARKRIPSLSGNSNVKVLAKRPRLVTPLLPSQVASPMKQAHASPSQSSPSSDMKTNPMVFERPLLTPVVHPRGGFAVDEAVSRVLAHKGMPELEVLPETHDRSKLTFFFGGARAEKKPASSPKKEQPLTAKGLDSWRARPWEDEEETPNDFAVGENPLAMRKPVFVFRQPWRS